MNYSPIYIFVAGKIICFTDFFYSPNPVKFVHEPLIIFNMIKVLRFKRTKKFIFDTRKSIINRKRRFIGNTKTKWRIFTNRFRAKYNVDVTLFHFIPGFPVKSNRTRHRFNKGEFKEAKLFFDKASAKTKDSNVAPVEINLVKGKSRILISRHFGPVKILKRMRISA